MRSLCIPSLWIDGEVLTLLTLIDWRKKINFLEMKEEPKWDFPIYFHRHIWSLWGLRDSNDGHQCCIWSEDNTTMSWNQSNLRWRRAVLLPIDFKGKSLVMRAPLHWVWSPAMGKRFSGKFVRGPTEQKIDGKKTKSRFLFWFFCWHCHTTSHSTSPHPVNRARRWFLIFSRISLGRWLVLLPKVWYWICEDSYKKITKTDKVVNTSWSTKV